MYIGFIVEILWLIMLTGISNNTQHWIPLNKKQSNQILSKQDDKQAQQGGAFSA
jgi:hypothetical protein